MSNTNLSPSFEILVASGNMLERSITQNSDQAGPAVQILESGVDQAPKMERLGKVWQYVGALGFVVGVAALGFVLGEANVTTAVTTELHAQFVPSFVRDEMEAPALIGTALVILGAWRAKVGTDLRRTARQIRTIVNINSRPTN